MTDYLRSERRLYKPPPCPDCGSSNVDVDWIDVSGMATPPGQERYTPGAMSCRDCRNLQT
jgi:hypothetical protein